MASSKNKTNKTEPTTEELAAQWLATQEKEKKAKEEAERASNPLGLSDAEQAAIEQAAKEMGVNTGEGSSKPAGVAGGKDITTPPKDTTYGVHPKTGLPTKPYTGTESLPENLGLSDEQMDAIKKAGDTRLEDSIAVSKDPTEEELARDARLTSANMEDAQRRASYLAARNTGANRAAASAVAGNQVNEGGQTSAQSALRSTAVGTQADYLNKMGYANALDMQSENKKKGAFLNTMSGIFSGAGEGASVGASLGGAR